MTEMMTRSEEAAPPEVPGDDREVLGGRLFEALVGSAELFTVQLGLQLGLYASLGDDDLKAGELAARAGVDARYTREWLEQQAAAGLAEVDDVAASPEARRYRLPSAHREVLLEETSPWFMGAAGPFALSLGATLPRVAEAFRSGGGVRFADYGAEVRHGIASMNRPAYAHALAREWLPAVPAVHRRLQESPAARVLDLGCGLGHSSVALAEAYPGVTVRGVDLDAASVADARRVAADAGVADRVTFEQADAADLVGTGRYDLVTIFEALHDMGDPVGALRASRRLLAPGGSLLLMDERTSDAFTAPAEPYERFLHASSVLHCLPATRAERHVEAHGTLLRAATVEAWAAEAGFSAVDRLPISHDFWQFFHLLP